MEIRLSGLVGGEIVAWIEALLRSMPGRAGGALRRAWFKRRFMRAADLHIGTGCHFVAPGAMSFSGMTLISDGCYFNADGGAIEVGDWTAFNRGAHINASCGGTISIGAHCPIGPGVVMRTANHVFARADVLIQKQGHEPADIVVEDDCWIGANVVIVGGVRIGRGAVVGAGAVVTKDVPPLGIAVGVPAKVIRYRGAAEVAR